MKVKFNIDYRTTWGQKIMVSGSAQELGAWDESKALELKLGIGEKWEVEIDIDLKNNQTLEYKYFLKDDRWGYTEWEFGESRKLNINTNRFDSVDVRDYWRPNQDEQNALYTAPFTKSLFSPEEEKLTTRYKKDKHYIRFQIRMPRVSKPYKVCIVGETKTLGNWKEEKAVVMKSENFPVWQADVVVDPKDLPIQYKYAIYDEQNKKVVTWESRDNRMLPVSGDREFSNLTVWTDENFVSEEANWKGTGVAIPVFSLRSKNGLGVGEFPDLKLMVDWAVKTGIKMVQVLPINDTVANHNWSDSYPYAAISVFALHPMYLNLEQIADLNDEEEKKFIQQKKDEFNALEYVEYVEVMEVKSRYLKKVFDQEKDQFLKDLDFQDFFAKNRSWLVPYAAFSYLRDLNQTPNFNNWEQFQTITKEELQEFCSPSQEHYDHIAIHYFIQYHLHLQLNEATEYARDHGVVLKGDIPIGVYRYSADAWVDPHLYNMDAQAGAPPDDFSVTGQNWGFPTYNWEEMAKDGYAWWQERLTKMSEYFDVFRIDHILGFFRIWEIPMTTHEGLLGHFNPALPIHVNEFSDRGIWFQKDRFCKPYIREHILYEMFGEEVEIVKWGFLDQEGEGMFSLKPYVDTQQKIKAYFEQLNQEHPINKDRNDLIEKGLHSLVAEVLFFEMPDTNGEFYNPRISFHSTYSFRELDEETKQKLDELYTHYFYKRHNEFWRKQAMTKLPALKDATDMLICGEDLGMVPDSVPGVMTELGILSLAIQRMPNAPEKEFWNPSDTNYLSVCSTSSHDMSTLRGWWEEDREATQRFYNNILGNYGEAPFYCEPWIAQQIITQHLYSPSMWAIFPIQDLLAIDGRLRRVFPKDERINVPANPNNEWKYRLHISLEDLIEEGEFNATLKQANIDSGRYQDF